MRLRARLCALLVPLLLGSCGSSSAQSPLRINGSTTVNPVAAECAEILRAERGLSTLVDTQGGSSGGIAMLGEGRVEIGMSSKPLKPSDRARYPAVDFVEHRVGQDAVALCVSADVWRDGVRSLSRRQMRDIYEGRVTNWKDVGGPDRRIAFFNKEPGRGTWEVFARWLYGDSDRAPAAHFPEVGGNEEARSKIAGTPGALGQLSYAWADRETVFPLAILVNGEEIEPTPATVADGSYPMSRRLFLLTDGPPRGAAKAFVDFVLSPRGQEIVSRHGYLPIGASGP